MPSPTLPIRLSPQERRTVATLRRTASAGPTCSNASTGITK